VLKKLRVVEVPIDNPLCILTRFRSVRQIDLGCVPWPAVFDQNSQFVLLAHNHGNNP
jgi:hypothetical protein